MVIGPDAVVEDTVAESDCADPAAPEGNVRKDDTVSGVVAVSDDDDIVDAPGADSRSVRSSRSATIRLAPPIARSFVVSYVFFAFL